MPSDKLNISDKPHIIIRASAGSGKTYQLSNRYLDLLHRDASPSTILATTFTRKAAGEILERILRRLAEAVTDADKRKVLAAAFEPEDPRDHPALTLSRVRQMLVTLCRSLHRASVSTIDSFFHRIASSFRYELKLPPDPRMVEASDALAVRLRLQAIETMLGDEDVEVLIDLLKRLHHDQTRRGITQAIDDIVADLYDTYRVTQRHHWEQLDPPPPLSLDEVAQLVSGLGTLLEGATTKPLAKALATARDHAMRSDWESFLGTGLAAKILADPDEPVFNRAPITADQLAIFLPLIAHAKATLLTFLARQTAATFDLLHRFDAHYTRLREQQRLLLYSDLPFKLAHELPRQDETLLTEICYRLDGAVSHLLLDEFQDTSFDQWRVLAPFAEEVTSYSDGSRTFFCVGDVKQAIYGWRGGRAELFNQIPAQLNLSDEAQVTLDVSYRSSQIVLDVVNEVFHSLPQSDAWTAGENDRDEVKRWADDFRAHRANHAKQPGYVEFLTSPPSVKNNDISQQNNGDSGEQDQDDEGGVLPADYEQFVAERIAQLHRQMPGRSIGVLVSTNSAATPLLRRLRDLGVDASAEGRDALLEDPAVEVVLSALRLADHPGHSAAAFHVLNSPLAPIIGLRSTHPRITAPIALQIRCQIVARGFAAVLAQWSHALAPSCDAASVRKLLQLIELADRYEIDASARLGPFVDAVEHATFEEPSTSPVRVMTIHKSKGLEFDVVVLPQLDKKMGSLGTRQGVTILRDPHSDEVQAVYRGTNACTRALSESVQQAYEQERMRRLRDDLCLLYVAMTRAKHGLHLITTPVKMNKTGLSKRGLFDQSFASVLRHALCDDPSAEDPAGNQTLYTHGHANWDAGAKPVVAPRVKDESPVTKVGLALDPEPGSTQRSWRIVSPSSLHQERQRSIADLLAIKPDEARSRGSLFHSWFELIQWLDDREQGPGDDELLERARRVMKANAPKAQDDAGLQKQIAEFRRMISQPAVRQALTVPTLGKGETTDLWRERGFAVRLKDELLRGTFDRAVIIRRGDVAVRAQLIDFKTDRLRSSGDLKERGEHYRPQIEAYRAALAAMLSLPRSSIKATLLFVHDGQRCEM